jgi:hypothetical protein
VDGSSTSGIPNQTINNNIGQENNHIHNHHHHHGNENEHEHEHAHAHAQNLPPPPALSPSILNDAIVESASGHTGPTIPMYAQQAPTETEQPNTTNPPLSSIPTKQSIDDDDDINESNSNNDNYHHPNNNNSSGSGGGEAIIVCGVDGTIYTLDAWTGQLRGMFTSGPPIIESEHNHIEDEDGASNNDNDDDNDIDSNLDNQHHHHHVNKERVIPGLNGHLYTLTENWTNQENVELELVPLPIDIQEVLDHPVSTCRKRIRRKGKHHFDTTFQNSEIDHDDADDEEDYYYEEQCGLVMGQVQTKIFALDPTSGTVIWMQNLKDEQRGFTASTSAKLHGSKSKPVILQREDIKVKNVDIESGEEEWNVALGKFTALDLGTSKSGQGINNDNNGHGNTSMRWHSRVPSLPSRSELTWKGDNNSPNRSNKGDSLPDATSFITFPSVAFGDDGMSLQVVASDGSLLWSRSIESHVASVFGVGIGSRWVPLNVVQESDILNHDTNSNLDVKTESSEITNAIRQNDAVSKVPLTFASITKELATVPLVDPNRNSMETTSNNFLPGPVNDVMCSGSDTNGEGQCGPTLQQSIEAKVGKYMTSYYVVSTNHHEIGIEELNPPNHLLLGSPNEFEEDGEDGGLVVVEVDGDELEEEDDEEKKMLLELDGKIFIIISLIFPSFVKIPKLKKNALFERRVVSL